MVVSVGWILFLVGTLGLAVPSVLARPPVPSVVPASDQEAGPASNQPAPDQEAGPAPRSPSRLSDRPNRWRIMIEREIIIRVPMRPSTLNNFPTGRRGGKTASNQAEKIKVTWQEKSAPRCISMRHIRRVHAVRRDSIDLLTHGKRHVRAHLHRGCRALDFYSGFYMRTNKDGRLCANRDRIQARSGAQCMVDKFGLIVQVSEPLRSEDIGREETDRASDEEK